MEEDDRDDDDGRQVEDQRPHDRDDSGNLAVVKGRKEAGTEGRDPLEEEGEREDRETVDRDLLERCVPMGEGAGQRIREKLDHDGGDNAEDNDDRHALLIQILQVVRIAGPEVIRDQRGNTEHEAGSDGSENRVDITDRTVGGNAHIADHIEEKTVVNDVDEGTRDIGEEFGGTVSAGFGQRFSILNRLAEAQKACVFAGKIDQGNETADEKAGSLSYGKQKNLEIARAMATMPELLLLDEPASGLNTQELDQLSQRVLRMRDMGITVVLIEHKMDVVMNISNKIMVLNFGESIAFGTPEEISADPHVIEAYLGKEDEEDA